ncbi:hypothetical protein [Bosea sp. CS1GBMeth4]|uniref:hypothetical protein n=1 Tax=Bosea sp. CS1GBMeth4 TaxID=1892849 RepID=UPI001645E149|nr:hypothetical protein [Bosea sp. CS1GBMeth4]
MELFLAWLLRQMRRARIVFVGLYLLVVAGFAYAEPRSAWTWLIALIGALLCVGVWGLVGFWHQVFMQRRARGNEVERNDG